MDEFYVFIIVMLDCIIALAIFIAGVLFGRKILRDAIDDACYDRLKEEYYRLAGYRYPGDPKPYVPPKSVVIPRRRVPRSRMLPGMGALERAMREGKRGTIMWNAANVRGKENG